jgi:hypothetical protein
MESFLRHLCPVLDLDAMVRIHRVVGGERYRRDDDKGCIDGNDEATTTKKTTTTTTTTSRAVASHAWLNT